MQYKINNDELMHYGILGMKWGVRNAETRAKYASQGKASFRTKRMAKKDAKEYAQAKMYYGEGAGTRRKLIKNKVEQRRKDRPGYSEEFDKRLDATNWDKTVDKAKGQRHRKDAADTGKKTARGVVHAVAGNPMYASATALALVGGWKVAKQNGWDKKVINAGKAAYNNAKGAAMLGKMMWNAKH